MRPENIKRALKKRKITQRKLAASCGVTEQMVSKTIWNVSYSRKVCEAIANAIEEPIEKVFSRYRTNEGV